MSRRSKYQNNLQDDKQLLPTSKQLLKIINSQPPSHLDFVGGAKYNIDDAKYKLALYYRDGTHGVEKDICKYLQMSLELASPENYPDAISNQLKKFIERFRNDEKYEEAIKEEDPKIKNRKLNTPCRPCNNISQSYLFPDGKNRAPQIKKSRSPGDSAYLISISQNQHKLNEYYDRGSLCGPKPSTNEILVIAEEMLKRFELQKKYDFLEKKYEFLEIKCDSLEIKYSNNNQIKYEEFKNEKLIIFDEMDQQKQLNENYQTRIQDLQSQLDEVNNRLTSEKEESHIMSLYTKQIENTNSELEKQIIELKFIFYF